MSFDPVLYLKEIVENIEGKAPVKIVDYFNETLDHLEANAIVKDMHVGKTDYKTLKEASEFLLGQYIGIVIMGRENTAYYNAFGHWLKLVYHFVINNNTNLE